MAKTPTALVPRAAPALTRQPARVDVAATFERLAKDKRIDVAKLEKLVELQERIMAQQRQAEFNAAYAAMQPELPAVDKRGLITVPASGDRAGRTTPYAKFEHIQEAVKPVLARFGFSIRFRTEWPKTEKIIRIVGILSHSAGHFEESAFEALADDTGSKNAVQARGSTIQYARRYTTCDLLNITIKGADFDGQSGPSRQRDDPRPPHGSDGSSGEVISDAQRKRLWVIAKKAGRTGDAALETKYRAWLQRAYGISSTKLILRRDYDQICKLVEAKGELPEPVKADPVYVREAGEEG